jgi:hypothetical protein
VSNLVLAEAAPAAFADVRGQLLSLKPPPLAL